MSTQPFAAGEAATSRRSELLRRIACLFKTYPVPADTAVLPSPFLRDDRNCFTTWFPPEWPSDERGVSPALLYEDGLPLGPAHSSHDDIRTLGKGRYSHWGAALYFSSSDNTNPNENGRIYSVQPPPGWTGSLKPPRQLLRPAPAAVPSATASAAPRRTRVRWSMTDVEPADITAVGGAAYSVPVPPEWGSDMDSVSTLLLMEDGAPLPHPHGLHAEIGAAGGGRYSHWNGTLFFSASDGSDPRSNGRAYSITHAEALLFSHAPSRPFHDAGHCYILSTLPRHWEASDPLRARVLLLEDGRVLGPAQAPHDEIRELGRGRFSHWGHQLFFSTGDNTDPNGNGRTYTVVLAD